MSAFPPLIALKAFVAVGRTQSIRRASEQLHVDHSGVSRHLQNLEARLGVKLLRQDGRGVVLTAEGQKYYERVSRAFEDIAQATSDLRRSKQRTIDLYATAGFAHRKLLPQVPQLQDLLAGWDVILHPTTQPAEQRAPDRVYVEVSYSKEPPARHSVRFEHLATPRVFPVVNPRVSASWLSSGRPSDLVNLPLIHANSLDLWMPWFRELQVQVTNPLRGPHLESAHLALEAARYGQGIALSNEILVEVDLRAGDLVELFDTDVRLGAYFVSTSEQMWEEEPVRVVRDWLQQLLPPTTEPAAQ